jgi:hypothetical protein
VQPNHNSEILKEGRNKKMLQTIEVQIDDQGIVRPIDTHIKLPEGRALLTILEPVDVESTNLSEQALAVDWLKPEEEEAWEHLQSVKL